MSVIRVVARITPLNNASLDLSERPESFPEEFGNPISVEMCRVTDPRNGLQYAMETAIIVKKYDLCADVSKEVSSECERMPGFVCADAPFCVQGSCPVLSASPRAEENVQEYASLSLPSTIRRESVPLLVNTEQLVSADEPEQSPSLKLRFNLKTIEKERKNIHARRRARNLLKPLTRYFIEDECLICGLVAPKTNVLEHMSTHVHLNSYRCDCCKLPFVTPKALYLHMLNKSEECRYSCGICSTDYQRKHLLTVHQLKNHTELTSQFAPSGDDQSIWKQNIPLCYSCLVCEERLMSLDDVLLHKELHPGEGSFQCLFCGKWFGNAGLLRYHTHVRMVVQKFPCRVCGEEFPSSRVLQQHHKSHALSSWACQVCGDKKFYFEKTFLKHMKLIHGAN